MDPPEGSDWLSFLLIFSLGKKKTNGKPRVPGGFLLKRKSTYETTLLDLSDGSSNYSWKDGLIEFQFLPQKEILGVAEVGSWMGFSMDFLRNVWSTLVVYII